MENTMFRLLASALALLAIPAAAFAHVVFAEPEAAPNAYYAGFIRISHGCGGSPTRSVRVEIPDGVNIARPQPKAGWVISVERAPLATPLRNEAGDAVTERVTSITWTGELLADQFDVFGIMMKLPDRAGPLYFPVTQTCVSGEQRWTDIPPAGAAWHSVPHPAPVVTLVAPANTERAHDHH
jgi:periplasmic copper chaperone A